MVGGGGCEVGKERVGSGRGLRVGEMGEEGRRGFWWWGGREGGGGVVSR